MKIGDRAGDTHPGRKRPQNEDSYVCDPPLFAVADGMGGARAGELASSLAAMALRDGGDRGGGEAHVAELIQEANRRVFTRSSEDEAASGMGTTITVALVEGNHVTIGHVGDSRAYLVRDGRLEQLTEDHNLTGELLRSGKLSPEEARTHPQRSLITRAVGTDPDVDVDTFTVEARPGDVFLLCSDGLTSMVDDDRILAVLERERSALGAAARALIREANRGGGEDNITVVTFELVEGEPSPDEQGGRLPVEEADPYDDEEDTLSGIDAVPAVDTVVVGPEQARRLHEAIEEAGRRQQEEQGVMGGAVVEPGPSVEPSRLPLLLALALLAVLAVVAAVLWWVVL